MDLNEFRWVSCIFNTGFVPRSNFTGIIGMSATREALPIFRNIFTAMPQDGASSAGKTG
jgi:hypothetical protein